MTVDIGNGQMLGSRESQQDYFATFKRDDHDFLVLADGIGGLPAGEHASQIAVKTSKEYVLSCDLTNHKQVLADTAKHANSAIAAASDTDPKKRGMGTTLIIAMITDTEFRWISIGDSLVYRYRNGSLSQLNASHTRIAELQVDVARGSISQSEADEVPDRYAITSALAGDDIAHTDINAVAKWPDDKFLIASDGVQTLRHSALQRLVSANTGAQEVVDNIISSVEKAENSFQDNCTVILAMPFSEKSVAPKYRLNLLYIALFVALIFGLVLFLFWFMQRSDSASAAAPAEVISKPATEVIVKPVVKEETPENGDQIGETGIGEEAFDLMIENPVPEATEIIPTQVPIPDNRKDQTNPKPNTSSGGFFTNKAEEANEINKTAK